MTDAAAKNWLTRMLAEGSGRVWETLTRGDADDENEVVDVVVPTGHVGVHACFYTLDRPLLSSPS
jgi:hypothetical protein